ncbi:MAG: phosphotransferase, partial [Lachnospiraceae bacterium]|nr:phosphotransferase [Lachnospiraceae bacterium]
MNSFYERIDKIENIDILSSEICKEYNLGEFINTTVIETGYEDFNAILETMVGKYFVKVFTNSRDDKEVKEVIDRINVPVMNNIPAPKIYKNSQNNLLSILKIGNSRFRVALMEYIDGQNFFELQQKPTDEELSQIVDIATRLSKIDYKPQFIYDSWAITGFCLEFEKKRDYLDNEYIGLLEPIYEKVKQIDYELLPKAYVHGDMMSTNIMKDAKGKLWVIDFSVSNYTTRLNEIAVICHDLALVDGNKEESERRIKYAFE